MARYRRRRFRKRSGKWAPNIKEFNADALTESIGKFYNSAVLATNPAQSDTLVSQVYTVKNFDINFSIETKMDTDTETQYAGRIENLTAYIMFLPQGMNLTASYNLQHPEYIMACKYIGSPTSDTPLSAANPIRVRTRLARKLQTGDSIILFVTGYEEGTTQIVVPLTLTGVCRWWTKAN